MQTTVSCWLIKLVNHRWFVTSSTPGNMLRQGKEKKNTKGSEGLVNSSWCLLTFPSFIFTKHLMRKRKGWKLWNMWKQGIISTWKIIPSPLVFLKTAQWHFIINTNNKAMNSFKHLVEKKNLTTWISVMNSRISCLHYLKSKSELLVPEVKCPGIGLFLNTECSVSLPSAVWAQGRAPRGSPGSSQLHLQSGKVSSKSCPPRKGKLSHACLWCQSPNRLMGVEIIPPPKYWGAIGLRRQVGW